MVRYYSGGRRGNRDDEEFKLSKVFHSFTNFPRVLRLVLSTSAPLTISLALLNILSGITPAFSVTISQLTIDAVLHGIRTHTISPIWLPVALQLGVGLLDRLLSSISNIVQQLLQNKVSNRMQLLILEKANTLDLSFFEDAEFYDKMRHASDESNYRPVTLISQTFGLGRTVITMFSMIFLLTQLAWWLALIALVIPIPSFIANTRYGWRGYRRKVHQSQARRLMYYFTHVMTVDNFNKEIKLFNLGDFFIKRYHDLAEKIYNEDRQILIPRYLANFLWSGLTVSANSSVYLYVALQAVLGRITLGALTKYTQASVQAGQSFQGVLDGISGAYENNLYINTLFEFLEYQPHIVSPDQPVPIEATPEVKGLDIEFRNVSFTYPGKKQAALNNVSFTIRAGEAIALVGRNGAGKTTLVKLLTRLYDPDEGEILIGGRDIREYSLKDLREQVGVIFQDYVRYELKASENIGMGRIDDIDNQELIASSAHKSGADSVIERLAGGYDTMLGRWFDEGVQLSGGEWQKVALARAFMRDARILILDEPTSALDAQAEYDVFTRFRILTEGKTAVFISHRFSTVRLADRIFVIEDGNIIESGSHYELIELDGRYAELFNLQAEAYR
ncbi:MAG TPA: ABC transporter ATP-binding protein [Ktedonobacteraceae bacterium]|nr:ABC transporter ATP-binding protein [Ktedonobacteraceae bacterium]